MRFHPFVLGKPTVKRVDISPETFRAWEEEWRKATCSSSSITSIATQDDIQLSMSSQPTYEDLVAKYLAVQQRWNSKIKGSVCVAFAFNESRNSMYIATNSNDEDQDDDGERPDFLQEFRKSVEFTEESRHHLLCSKYADRVYQTLGLTQKVICVLKDKETAKRITNNLNLSFANPDSDDITDAALKDFFTLATQIDNYLSNPEQKQGQSKIARFSAFTELVGYGLFHKKSAVSPKLEKAFKEFTGYMLSYCVCSLLKKELTRDNPIRNKSIPSKDLSSVDQAVRRRYSSIDDGGITEKIGELKNVYYGLMEQKEKELIQSMKEDKIESILKLVDLESNRSFWETVAKASKQVVYLSEKCKLVDEGDLHCEVKLFMYMTHINQLQKTIRFYISKPLCLDCTMFFQFLTGTSSESSRKRPQFMQQQISCDHFFPKQLPTSCCIAKSFYARASRSSDSSEEVRHRHCGHVQFRYIVDQLAQITVTPRARARLMNVSSNDCKKHCKSTHTVNCKRLVKNQLSNFLSFEPAPTSDCFFHAVQHWLNKQTEQCDESNPRPELSHSLMISQWTEWRMAAVEEVSRNTDLYKQWLDDREDMKDYLDRMKLSTEWVDNIIIKAFVNVRKLKLIIHHTEDPKQTTFEPFVPQSTDSVVHVLRVKDWHYFGINVDRNNGNSAVAKE